MNIHQEFSRFAHKYGQYNVVQNKVAKKLLDDLRSKPLNILDLGCGNGTIVKNIDWSYNSFTAVDFSSSMLELHPKSDTISCCLGDFNDDKLFEKLRKNRFDYIFSSSALQWADNLDKTLYQISKLNAPVSFAIFTSNTFKTVLETARLRSPLRTKEEVADTIKKYYDCQIEIVNYSMTFKSTADIFSYIKKSGVSGGRNILSYKQMKELMNDYPTKSLEFEVLFAGN